MRSRMTRPKSGRIHVHRGVTVSFERKSQQFLPPGVSDLLHEGILYLHQLPTLRIQITDNLQLEHVQVFPRGSDRVIVEVSCLRRHSAKFEQFGDRREVKTFGRQHAIHERLQFVGRNLLGPGQEDAIDFRIQIVETRLDRQRPQVVGQLDQFCISVLLHKPVEESLAANLQPSIEKSLHLELSLGRDPALRSCPASDLENSATT